MPLYQIGDATKNVGAFVSAIFQHPDTALPGKYVSGEIGSMTQAELLATWAKVTGKATRFIELKDVSDYHALWPKWGEEMSVMLLFMRDYGTACWISMQDGRSLLRAKDLGLRLDQLATVEDGIRSVDWAPLLYN